MKTRQIAIAAVTGAAYTALTVALAPISYGPMLQFRISEALCVLPFLCPTSMWGLFVGCLLANLYSPVGLLDIIIGPLATLLAAFLTSRARNKWIAPLPPVIVNGAIIGFVLALTYTPDAIWQNLPIYAGWVALGELIVCYVLGMPLLFVLSRFKIFKDRSDLRP